MSPIDYHHKYPFEKLSDVDLEMLRDLIRSKARSTGDGD